VPIPTLNDLHYKGAGTVQVFPLLPTQINDAQDGADVGTGGGTAGLETPPTNNRPGPRVVDFVDDRFCLTGASGAANAGCFRRSQGGAGQWGRAAGGGQTISHGSVSGLHVFHPNSGTPVIGYLQRSGGAELNQLRYFYSLDGVSDPGGGAWGAASVGVLVEANSGSNPTSYGHSIIYRDSIVWCHARFSGAGGTGQITIWDPALSTMTRLDAPNMSGTVTGGGQMALAVHNNKLYVAGWRTGGTANANLWRMDSGALIDIYGPDPNIRIAFNTTQPELFTDQSNGELMWIANGIDQPAGAVAGLRLYEVQTPEGTPAIVDRTGPVFQPLIITHGGVSGGSGNFEVGETLTSTSGGSGTIASVPSGTQVVLNQGFTGAFNDTDTLTQTTGSGGTATQSGASVAGPAAKYLAGGAVASADRHWQVFVDTETNPLAPATYLWTWLPGGNRELWLYTDNNTGLILQAAGAGISDDFVVPRNTNGDGIYSPRTAAVEIGDDANPPVEEPGGTRVYFRGRGSVAAGTVTFYGTDDEDVARTVVPIIGGTFQIEGGGSPPTTPTISGNTLINFTPDNGATLYSVRLDVDAAGVDIGEGDVGMIRASFV
jgi:hypothetical protein